MRFTRFIAIVFASMGLAFVLIALLPKLGIAKPGAEIAWTASLYSEKTRIAQMIKGPRVLVVGGSSTLFSFDTVTATKTIGKPAVNFGTHAGLGLNYILDHASRLIRPGDEILLAPEYELLQEDGAANEFTIQVAAFTDSGYVAKQPLPERLKFLMGYGVLPSLVEAIKWLRNGPPAGRADVALDALGNARGNTVALSKGSQLVGETPNLPPQPVSPAAKEALLAFAAVAQKNHAQIIVIPPALIQTSGYVSHDFRRFQDELRPFFLHLGMTVAGTASTGFLAPSDIYDSVYHANDRGRVLYTQRILAAVCQKTACVK